jgi:hypothetical protein
VPASDTSAPLIVFGHGIWGHPRKFTGLFARWVDAGYEWAWQGSGKVEAPRLPWEMTDAGGGDN